MLCLPFHGIDRAYKNVPIKTSKNKTVSVAKHLYRQVRDLREGNDFWKFIFIVL